VLDVAERHLQEAGAELAEGIGVSRAEEAIGPSLPGLLIPASSSTRWAVAAIACPAVTKRTSRPKTRWSIGATSG